MSLLFSPLRLRNVEFRNRIFVSPMCQYSAVDGMPNDWHMVHLGSRAVGGAALVIVEASGVSPEGRISAGDLGIWSDAQVRAFQPIVRFMQSQGARAGIQLAHAGRKASTFVPWKGGGPIPAGDRSAWQTFAPSAIPFDSGWHTPQAMSAIDIAKVVDDFAHAARRADTAGFDVIEIHAAHGYLLNEFLSPLSNHRTDQYGGSIENRMRLLLEVVRVSRAAWHATKPLFVRISASDWVEGGWTVDDSVVLSRELKNLGVDLVDCSSGGNSPHAKITVGPGYQVPFAEQVHREAGVHTGAVGLITDAHQAEAVLKEGKADVVLLARELLRDPYWPLHAARELGAAIDWPKQYERAKPREAK